MSITLLPAVNPARTVKYNSTWMVDGMLVIKDGVSYNILDGRYRRAVVTTLSKLPDETFDWGRGYIRARRVFRRDEEVLTAWEIIKLRQISNTATSTVLREKISQTLCPFLSATRVHSTKRTTPPL